MWMMVIFDLPVVDPDERKAATEFRNYLLDEGFEMAQFSVYVRFCAGSEKVEALTRRIKEHLPEAGKVDILFFTDKQYEKIQSFHGQKRQPDKQKPSQYSLF